MFDVPADLVQVGLHAGLEVRGRVNIDYAKDQQLSIRIDRAAWSVGRIPHHNLLRQLRRQREVQPILAEVAKAYRRTRKELLRPGTKGNEARAVAMVLIWESCGMRLREIGEL